MISYFTFSVMILLMQGAGSVACLRCAKQPALQNHLRGVQLASRLESCLESQVAAIRWLTARHT